MEDGKKMDLSSPSPNRRSSGSTTGTNTINVDPDSLLRRLVLLHGESLTDTKTNPRSDSDAADLMHALQQQRQHHGHQESIRKEEIKRRMDSWPWRELSLSCCWRLTMVKGVSLYEWWEVALDHGTILWTIQ